MEIVESFCNNAKERADLVSSNGVAVVLQNEYAHTLAIESAEVLHAIQAINLEHQSSLAILLEDIVRLREALLSLHSTTCNTIIVHGDNDKTITKKIPQPEFNYVPEDDASGRATVEGTLEALTNMTHLVEQLSDKYSALTAEMTIHKLTHVPMQLLAAAEFKAAGLEEALHCALEKVSRAATSSTCAGAAASA